MSDNEVKVGKNLLIQMLIYAPCGRTVIDVRNRQLSAKTKIGDIEFFHIVGGRDLSRDFWREVTLYKTVRRGRKSEHVEIGKVSGFALIAKHMSITLPISTEQCKALLIPFLEKGVERIYLYTKAGSLGLPSMIEPEWCKDRYGFKNKWLASGTRPVNDWSYVNQLLRERGSPYRVLVPSLDLGAEKELELSVELKKALKRIDLLEKER